MRRIFQCSNLHDSSDYAFMMKHLEQYQKQGDGRKWEEYRQKIAPDLLEIWGTVMVECRRNGFVNPRVRYGEIVFSQIISTGYCEDTDLCTLCERVCHRREMIDSGDLKRQKLINRQYQELEPCWEVRH